MKKAPIPNNEKQRLEAVHRAVILGTKPEDRFDNITKEAAEKLRVPISTVSILDSDKEWFKSRFGVEQVEGERSVSFCGHALMAKDLFVIEDTLKDERFADNPMVIGPPFIRFYAGMALFDKKTDQPIGVLCIKDIIPKKLNFEEIAIFLDLADRAEKELNQ